MIRLSVNVNKVATLRNSRGGEFPSITDAVSTCLQAGAKGITVHPRQDERHITSNDVHEVSELLEDHPDVEFNVEGDLRPDWLELVKQVRPQQATLVPVREGELTSEAGWSTDTDGTLMRKVISDLKGRGIRVSLFVEASNAAVRWAAEMGADRVELYTGPFAQAFADDPEHGHEVFAAHRRAAETANDFEVGVNAGHDLDLDNLVLYRSLPHLDEVSIGHALIGRALFRGLNRVVGEYLDCLES